MQGAALATRSLAPAEHGRGITHIDPSGNE
jgi:hypothetical protein